MTPEQFALVLCLDSQLPRDLFVAEIAKSIEEQIHAFEECLLIAPDPEDKVLIKVRLLRPPLFACKSHFLPAQYHSRSHSSRGPV